MLHFQPRKPVEETHFELVFRLEDGQGSAFAFACDEHGNVFRDQLPQIALHNLELCLRGEVDGYTVRRGVLRYHTQSFVEDASGTCICGEHVVLHDAWANTCSGCGREYNGHGQLLAVRSRWGEETGESAAEMKLGYDDYQTEG